MGTVNFAQSGNSSIYDAIAEATAPATDQEEQAGRKTRKEYSAAEADEFKNQMKTSGRKGVKLQRINLAFTPESYEYVQIMGRVSGEGMTAFINKALKQHREEHRDLYERAIEFRDALDNYDF